MKANVLIVDDDAHLRRALSDRLSSWDHSTVVAANGEQALRASQEREFDLILLDLSMPGMPGMEVLRRLRAEDYPADVVVLTAYGSLESAVEAIKLGATDFLTKPAEFELLRTVVQRSLQNRRMRTWKRAELEAMEQGNGLVVGDSAAMREVLDLASRAAASNATVLLTGESGSGKQVLAEFIHRQSPRKEGPFVYVNCVAMSNELIESTLFGHEKGAFTNAIARKEGRLEAAAGGTAFLDEVGDVSHDLQTKLLHFLETGEFERVGGSRTLSVDCRIIAATNRDLEVAMHDGKFREDLYYRLNVIRLRVPSLSDRPEDIPLLAQTFLQRSRAELKREPLQFASRTLEILKSYSWPGNVRQLKNAVERMAVLARSSTLTPDLLPPEVIAVSGDGRLEDSDLPLKEAVRGFKRRYIGQALAKTGGNVTRAAQLLGVQRSFLSRMLKTLDVG